jgi:hypothetical protein
VEKSEEVAMPIDYKRYPADWHAISKRIRSRARNRCQCTGECGTHNGKPLHRGRCPERNHRPNTRTGATVVLTVAHLGAPLADGSTGDKHNKHDCRDVNLKAMCQSCHLAFDLPDHIRHASHTRDEAKNKHNLSLPLEVAR